MTPVKRVECEIEGCGRAAALIEVISPFGCPVVCEPCALAIQSALGVISVQNQEPDQEFLLADAREWMRRLLELLRYGPASHGERLKWRIAGQS